MLLSLYQLQLVLQSTQTGWDWRIYWALIYSSYRRDLQMEKKQLVSSTGLLGTAPPINTQGWSYAHKWRTSSVFIKITGLNLVFSDPSCALPTSSKCDRWAGVQSAHWRPQRSDLFGVSNDIQVSWAGMSEQGLCFCFCVLTYKALKVQLTQDDILFSGFTYPDTVA